LTSNQLQDDVVFTDDAAFTPATSKGTMIMGQADTASVDSVDEGDAGGLRMSLDRALATKNEPMTVDANLDSACVAIGDVAVDENEIQLDTAHGDNDYLVSCIGGTGYIECGATGVDVTTTVGQFAFAIPDGAFVRMSITEDYCGVVGTVLGGFCCFTPLAP
jgi:hypothetical protein